MREISRRQLLAGGAVLAASQYAGTEAKADEVPSAEMPEGGVIILAQLTAKEGEEEVVRKALAAMVGSTRKEEGCICYNLHVSTKNPADFMFYEQWATQAALKAHGQTAHMKAMREATAGRIEVGGATKFELVD